MQLVEVFESGGGAVLGLPYGFRFAQNGFCLLHGFCLLRHQLLPSEELARFSVRTAPQSRSCFSRLSLK
jgi:hypothetical protein